MVCVCVPAYMWYFMYVEVCVYGVVCWVVGYVWCGVGVVWRGLWCL